MVQRAKGGRRMLGWLAVAIGTYAVILVLATVFQRSLIYFPNTSRPNLDRAGVAGGQEVTLTTADGLDLLAWYWPAADGSPTLAMVHGNAGNIGPRAPKMASFVAAGFGVLLVEYRGYGGNPGRPTEQGLKTDGAAALAWLRDRGVPPDRTVLYGESLGSGVAVFLATQHPVAAVVLEAPYTSITALARRQFWFLPVDWLLWDRFDSLSRIADVPVPVLIVHGTADRVIPVGHGQALAAASHAELRLFEGAGHVTLFDHGADGVIRDWLRATVAGDGAAPG